MSQAGAPWRVLYDEGRVVAVDKASGVDVEDVAHGTGRKLIHRIDAATSGLVLLGHDARTVQRMQRLLREGRVVRRYLVVAHGVVAAGTVESVLVRDRGDGLRGTPLPSRDAAATPGKPARTTFAPLAHASDERATLAIAELDTGRTHQIRIQLAERGTPVIGEHVYVRDHLAAGLSLLSSPRLLLHAWQLAFVHPNTKRAIALEAPPPLDLREAAKALGIECPSHLHRE